MTRTDMPAVEAAYRHCWQLATAHYENFSIGSWLLPRPLRRHIAAIYAFARSADDWADEGDLTVAQRLSHLSDWERQLDDCYRGAARTPIFVALQDTVQKFAIPDAPFRRLLAAFRRDVEFRPFATPQDLLEYCRYSANPVGHLLLHLFGYADAERQGLADQVCSGLQLANFWQDVAVDAAKGRVYVPQSDLDRFGCTADDLLQARLTPEVQALLRCEVAQARQMLTDGMQLASCVEPRLAREVKLFAWGGLAILDRIEGADFDVFTQRPQLSKSTKGRLILRAFASSTVFSGESSKLPAKSDATRTSRGVRDDYAYCEAITRRSSSNFFYAFRLLSPQRRDALFAVYAFCRFVDDIADDSAKRDPRQLLERWRDELDAAFGGTPTHPIGRALADAARHFPIAPEHFHELIHGVEMDLTQRRYADFNALYEYCYRVASTVGLLCIEIFGYTNASARQYAIDLGIAFQLTNILRDVLEDSRRGRIYLPLEDFGRFDCSEDELLSGHYSPRLGALLAFECGRARAYYLRAGGSLAAEDRGSLAAAEAMRLIYERLLDRIEARHFDVFAARVTLPKYEKVTLALAAWGRSQLALRFS